MFNSCWFHAARHNHSTVFSPFFGDLFVFLLPFHFTLLLPTQHDIDYSSCHFPPFLQEDLDGDDNWSIAMAGATCLEAMARTIEDGIVPLILPFVTQVTQTTLLQHIHTCTNRGRKFLHPIKLFSFRFIVDLTLNEACQLLSQPCSLLWAAITTYFNLDLILHCNAPLLSWFLHTSFLW